MFNASNLRGLLKTSLVLSAVVTSLTGCGNDSITNPVGRASSVEVEAAGARSQTVAQINSASPFQLSDIVSCLPAGAAINPTPAFDENTTLSEFVALTDEIVAWRQSILDYIGTLPLRKIVEMTPCLAAVLEDGSTTESQARRVQAAISNLSITQVLSARQCFEAIPGMPEAPNFDPATASLSEIVAMTPALVAYKEAVVARLSTLSLGELAALTPCLVASGVIA